MICPKCNGNGSIPYPIDYEQGLFDETNCDLCGGSGEVMTEQEYLQSCNTEQLADVFFEYRYINATPQQQLWLSANEDFVKGGIVKWLKQPKDDTE